MRRLKNKLARIIPRAVHTSWCYQSCSGHGKCWKLPKRQEFCECDDGYSGLFCENEVMFNYWWFWTSLIICSVIVLSLPILWWIAEYMKKKQLRKEQLNESTSSSGSCSSQNSFSSKATSVFYLE